MSDQQDPRATGLDCADCRRLLPAYLDEGLDRPASLQVFLHLRACADCAAELARRKQLTDLLESLPRREPPADFDARILASVPYEAYRAMAELRGPRLPVILRAEALPGWVRAPAVRATGAGLAAVILAGVWSGLLPAGAIAAAGAGLLPEAVLCLQGIGRRLVLAVGQGRRGA